MKNIKMIAVWLGLVLYITIALSFVRSTKKSELCNSVELTIKDTTQNNFVDQKEITGIIEKKIGKFLGYPIDSINIAVVEQAIRQHPVIRTAEVYKSSEGILNVEIEQRNPILRVFTSTNKSFYIDQEGIIIPVSDHYISRVMVVSGSVPPLVVDSVLGKSVLEFPETLKLFNDLYQFAKYVNTNPFWKSQIEQIFVNQKSEMELATTVGDQVIVFGTIENFEKKLDKLKILYTEGLNKKGWNQYKTINVKFDNQVVCTKR